MPYACFIKQPINLRLHLHLDVMQPGIITPSTATTTATDCCINTHRSPSQQGPFHRDPNTRCPCNRGMTLHSPKGNLKAVLPSQQAISFPQQGRDGASPKDNLDVSLPSQQGRSTATPEPNSHSQSGQINNRLDVQKRAQSTRPSKNLAILPILPSAMLFSAAHAGSLATCHADLTSRAHTCILNTHVRQPDLPRGMVELTSMRSCGRLLVVNM